MTAADGRRGSVVSLRVTDEERAVLESYQLEHGGPRGFGPWLVWAARLYGEHLSRVLPEERRPPRETRRGQVDVYRLRKRGRAGVK